MIRSAACHPRLLSTLRSNQLVNSRNAPPDFEISSAVVYSNFVSPEEGNSILEDVQKRMQRYDTMKYFCRIHVLGSSLLFTAGVAMKKAIGMLL
jgi:hypothetical protein